MDWKEYLDEEEREYLADLRKAGINVEWIIGPLCNAIYTHGFDIGVEESNKRYEEGFEHGKEAELNARADAVERNRSF